MSSETGKWKMSGFRGFTIVELLVVLSLISILTAFAVFNLRDLRNPQNAAAMEIMSFIKQARAKAIGQTVSYIIKPVSASRIGSTYGASCSGGVQTPDPSLALSLPAGASLGNTTWSICFEPRGLSKNAVNIPVTQDGKTKTVQVVLGGAVRVI